MEEVEKVTTFKIFVGNLPEEASNEEVKKIFEEYGNVVECDCIGKKAFVHMEDDIEGKHAIGELQGKELHGNKLIIQESNSQDLPRLPTVKLSVKNVSTTVDARGLRNMFKRFGYIIEVELKNGEGFVVIEAIGDIKNAIKEMNGHSIDDLAMEVEPVQESVSTPTPTHTQPASNTFDSPIPTKKFAHAPFTNNRSRGTGSRGREKWNHTNQRNFGSWSESHNSYPVDSYKEDYDSFNNYGTPTPQYSHSPMHHRQQFHDPPERIPRDPHAHRQSQFRQRGGPNSRFMGPPPKNAMPSWDSPIGFRGRPLSRVGVHDRVPILRPETPDYGFEYGGGSEQNPWSSAMEEAPQYSRQGPWEEVFYEDEPLPSTSRSNNQGFVRRNVSGGNSEPLGRRGADMSVMNIPRRGGMGMMGMRGGRGRGRGRGQNSKFTAMTHEVAPGEKYPVPPLLNPSFRAPQKWQKEEVKRKVKRIKRPLVAAELPDYSKPVPEIPRPTLPRGAVLKPFPSPFAQHSTAKMGASSYDYDYNTSSNGNGSGTFSSFVGQGDNSNETSHMDFTLDEY